MLLFAWDQDHVYTYKNNSQNWGRGYAQLRDIHSTWSKMIQAYRYENVTQTILVYDESCGSQDGGFQRPTYYDIEKAFLSGQCSSTYAYHREQQITVLTPVPDKTDGLISPAYTTWNQGEPYPTAFSSNNGNGNFYYDDRNGHGYNHYELRRTTRAYTEGGSVKGADSEPMAATRNWVNLEINASQQ